MSAKFLVVCHSPQHEQIAHQDAECPLCAALRRLAQAEKRVLALTAEQENGKVNGKQGVEVVS